MATKAKKVTKTAILAALRSLGKTPDEIAASLRRRRIKAVMDHPHQCAIAQFLFQFFGFGRGCNADSRVGVAIGTRVCDVIVRTPPAIHKFVDSFDQKKYPKLVG